MFYETALMKAAVPQGPVNPRQSKKKSGSTTALLESNRDKVAPTSETSSIRTDGGYLALVQIAAYFILQLWSILAFSSLCHHPLSKSC